VTRHEYAKATRAALLDELLGAGIADARVESSETTVWVTTSAPKSAVDSVVAAHDPAAIDAAAAQEQSRWKQDVALLRLHQRRATSTNAENTEAIKAQTRMLRRVFSELRD
jgi:hypothetical protein